MNVLAPFGAGVKGWMVLNLKIQVGIRHTKVLDASHGCNVQGLFLAGRRPRSHATLGLVFILNCSDHDPLMNCFRSKSCWIIRTPYFCRPRALSIVRLPGEKNRLGTSFEHLLNGVVVPLGRACVC